MQRTAYKPAQRNSDMLAYALGLAGILVGTATDIHHREVPDWVNYTMVLGGIGIGSLLALEAASWQPLISSALGLLTGYLIGALMYYTGQWGGGDAKMIMGLGALLGAPLEFFTGAADAPLLAYFLIATIFAGAAYGIIWMAVLLVTKRKIVLPALKKKLRHPLMIKVRVAAMIGVALAAAAAFIWLHIYTLLLLFIAVVMLLTLYFALAVKAVEQTCFVKQQPVEDLVIGDWIIQEVRADGRVLVDESNTGITAQQIALLKEHDVETVKIKEGIPFVPSFLLAYVVAYYWYASGSGLLFWV